MEIVIRPRRGGKTTEAIKYLKANPYSVYITVDMCMAREAWINSGLSPADKWRFQAIDTVRTLRGRNISGVVIDNADMLLSYLCMAPVRLMTLTGPQVRDHLGGSQTAAEAQTADTRTAIPPLA